MNRLFARLTAPTHTRVAPALLVTFAALFASACSGTGTGGFNDVVSDMGGDATVSEGGEGGTACTSNEQCSNNIFCDGEELCVMGACRPGNAPCDDRRTCTMDACDEEARACTNMADNAACGGGNACLGLSRCDPTSPVASPTTGCTVVRPEDVPDCDDRNNCTLDRCDPTVGCVHAPRDLDGDGHVDRACTVDGTDRGSQGTDCDDGDANVYPGGGEDCFDGRDNNCNGQVDFQESAICRPTNDSCDSATPLTVGTSWGSTVGLANDYALGCNAGTFADAVFTFTLTETRDVTLSTNTTTAGAAISVVSSCGTPVTELRCTRYMTGAPTLRLRSLAAGTYRAIVETGATPAPFRITYRTDAPTPVAREESCPANATAPTADLENGTMQTVRMSTLENDYALSCGTANRKDAVFRLRLTETSNVTIRALSATGAGTSYVSVRRDPCGDAGMELRCASGSGSTAAVYSQRGLAAGTYWVFVEHSTDADVNILSTITPAPLTPVYTFAENPMGTGFVDVCAAPGATRILRAMPTDPPMGEPLVDDEVAVIPTAMLPFALRLYGNMASTGLTVSTNGWVSLAPSMTSSFSGRLGLIDEPNSVVAPLWTDLATRTGGVCYGTTGTAPNRVFIVQWDDATDKLSDGSHLSFEVQFFEVAGTGNNTIVFAYRTMDMLSRLPGAGIENEDGSLVTAYEGVVFTAPRTMRFTPSI